MGGKLAQWSSHSKEVAGLSLNWVSWCYVELMLTCSKLGRLKLFVVYVLVLQVSGLSIGLTINLTKIRLLHNTNMVQLNINFDINGPWSK